MVGGCARPRACRLAIALQIAYLLSMSFCGPLRAADGALPALSQIVQELRTQDRSLLNLKVDCEARYETRAPGTQRWQESPLFFAGTAWYNGMPGSKARIDIRKEVLEWIGGDAPFSEDSYSVGFDGEQGWLAHHKTGSVNKAFPSGGGTITPDRPKLLIGRMREYGTGVAFSACLWRNYEKQSLADFLQGLKPSIPVTISQERFENCDTVKIRVARERVFEYIFWLDPARGYALLGHFFSNTRADGSVWVIDNDRVTKLAQIIHGMWYPTEAYHEQEDPTTRAGTRLHYRASLVVGNDPAFTESIFSAQFPAGYTVDNKVLGRVYEVSPPRQDLQNDLNKLMTEISATTRQAGLAPPGDADSAMSSAPGTGQSRLSTYSKLAFYCAIGVMIAVLVALVRFRRKGAAAIATVVMVYTLSHTRSGMASSLTSPGDQIGQPGPLRMNCAVNVGYLISRYYGRTLSLDEFARLLDAGSLYERERSLLDLKRTLVSLGLDVEGLSAQPVERMLSFAQGNATIILRTQKKNGRRDGHFVAVFGLRDRYLLSDPPYGSAFIERSAISRNPVLSLATGEFLVVTERVSPRYDHPAIELDDNPIDIGSIPVTDAQFEGHIKYRNRGKQSLKILGVGATCGCTSGSSGDMEVAPGGRGTITVVFDKSKLPSGEVTRQVNLATNDPRNEVVKAVFKFFVQDSPAATDLRLSPQVVSYGRAAQAAITARATTFVVTLPNDTREDKSVVTEEISTPRLALVRLDDRWEPEGNGGQARIIRYRLTWKEPPTDGVVREEVRFAIDGRSHGKRNLVIRIEGDCLGDRPDSRSASLTGGTR